MQFFDILIVTLTLLAGFLGVFVQAIQRIERTGCAPEISDGDERDERAR